MERTNWKPLNLKRADIVFFIGIAGMLLLQILFLFSMDREEVIRTIYQAPLIVAMVTYLLIRLGIPRTPILLLPPAFALWFLLTRLINGDWYLRESYSYVYTAFFACYVLFAAPFLAGRERRGKLFRMVAWIYGLSFSVIAWVAVIAALTGTPWVNPLDGVNILGINEMYNSPYRLNVLGMHPNISAIFFYTSLSLFFYLFFRTKRIWIRIVLGVLGVGLYLAICMTGSISAIAVTGGIIGLVVFALVFRCGILKKMRVLAAILAMLAVTAAVVASYPLVIQWTTDIYDKVQKRDTAVAFTLLTTAAAEAGQPSGNASAGQETVNDGEPAAFPQERLEIESMTGNMRSRFVMYSSAFLSIADRPATLLIGELQQDAMDRSARMINFPLQNHVHNSFLQTLVVGGGVSCLMAIVFTVLLIVQSVRLFFAKTAPLCRKMLVLAPAGLVVHSMTESLLFVDIRLPNMLFFFLAGMIVAYASELPGKKEQEAAAPDGAARP